MSAQPALVSVVIPAYDAEATLDETLRSVRSQTHAALEILVVDDGSRDATCALARRHAAADARVQVIRQANAGVAAARNNGWKRARSDLIAFVDADDLWAPTKIERQLEVMQAAGPRVGLVYCWFARIDARGAITSVPHGVRCEGEVLDRLLLGNFIGNGSSALVRREALVHSNGFESALHAAGAQGCEDLLFYCRVAERYHFALVPDYLIGYRHLPHNMSSDRLRMLRSWLLVAEEMRARHPQRIAHLKAGLREYASWLARNAFTLGAHRQAFQLPLLLLARGYPDIAARVLMKDVLRMSAGRARRWLRGEPLRGGPRAIDACAERFAIGRVDP